MSSWFNSAMSVSLASICFSQSFYPISNLITKICTQSRLFLSLLQKIEPESKKHGGILVASVLKAHKVENVFTSTDDTVSPIVVALNELNIKDVDVPHESSAVFAADAAARLSGVPGVALVMAGPGLRDTLKAIENARLAESPVVVLVTAPANLVKKQVSLQDGDQLSSLKLAAKKCFSVDCVRDITPALREAFRISQVGVPGPVLVELPVDTLYSYNVIEERFGTINTDTLLGRMVEIYTQYSLHHIFADAWKECDLSPLPVILQSPTKRQVCEAADLLKNSGRPLIVMGSQSVLGPHRPQDVAECIKKLKVPVYLEGTARGLLGSNFSHGFRQAREEALIMADCVLLLGVVCNHRLSFGKVFTASTKVISVNRSMELSKLNSRIFWNPALAIECDIGTFIKDLVEQLELPSDGSGLQYVDDDWYEELRDRDAEEEDAIQELAEQEAEIGINPLKVLQELDRCLLDDDEVIFVVDGADFPFSAAIMLEPCAPRRWLDPGRYWTINGTLGCGAGFALAAKVLNPNCRVVAVMSDKAFGYVLPQLDTLMRHKMPILWIVGTSLNCDCQLSRKDYPQLANAFGAIGYELESNETVAETLEFAKQDLDSGSTVVVSYLIGVTEATISG